MNVNRILAYWAPHTERATLAMQQNQHKPGSLLETKPQGLEALAPLRLHFNCGCFTTTLISPSAIQHPVCDPRGNETESMNSEGACNESQSPFLQQFRGIMCYR